MHLLSPVDSEKLVGSMLPSVVFRLLCDLLSVSLPLVLWKSASQKANGAQKEGKRYGDHPK
jgi:hypothetical protein